MKNQSATTTPEETRPTETSQNCDLEVMSIGINYTRPCETFSPISLAPSWNAVRTKP
jgi:hypothetical protein